MSKTQIPNLKRLRNERRLTQAQLGAALGIASRTILRWENGDGEPGASELLALARFFEVSIDQLISELLTDAAASVICASDLVGDQLNCWVAKTCGFAAEMTNGGAIYYEPGYGQKPVPAYSTDWAHGGPLIERKSIQLQPISAGTVFAGVRRDKGGWLARSPDTALVEFGETALIAAMRAVLVGGLGPALVG